MIMLLLILMIFFCNVHVNFNDNANVNFNDYVKVNDNANEASKQKIQGLGADVGRILDHFGVIFGDFLGPGGSLGASLKGRRLFIDFWSFLEAYWGHSWGPCCAKIGLLNFLK